MADDRPQWMTRPPLRCGWRPEDDPSAICGELAAWMAAPGGAPPPELHCARHRAASDQAIAEDVPYRRIAVTLEVLFCGVGRSDVCARAEVLARLTRGVEAVGGLVNLHAVTSVIGRSRAQAGRGPDKAGEGA